MCKQLYYKIYSCYSVKTMHVSVSVSEGEIARVHAHYGARQETGVHLST